MPHLREQILAYPDLSREAQQEIEREVARHPELAPLLAQAKALDALLRQARAFSAQPPGDEALAFYVARGQTGDLPASPALEAVLEGVKKRLETDADYRARYEHFRQRMQQLDEQSDPVAQFEQLAGYALDEEFSPEMNDEGLQKVASRPPARRVARRVVAGVAVCLTLYGGLFIVSEATRSDLERLAYVEAADVPEVITLRGGVADAPDASYREALALLYAAQESTLCLFPRYDAERLALSAQLLNKVLADEAEGSYKALEATFYLGKIRIAQHDIPAARVLLQEVIDGGGARADEAERLLSALDDEAAHKDRKKTGA